MATIEIKFTIELEEAHDVALALAPEIAREYMRLLAEGDAVAPEEVDLVVDGEPRELWASA